MQPQHNLETASGTCDCPACGEPIGLDDVMENEIVECLTCGGEFEVLSLDPFDLEELEEDQEDYGE